MTDVRPARARQQKTDEAIMDVAETLFGRHGPEGVSLRQIGAAAGSANNFAVQYHFKTREELIQRVFARRLPSLESRRAELLRKLVAADRAGDTRLLLEALLLPIADERTATGTRSFAAFLLSLRVFSDLPGHWLVANPSAPETSKITALLRDSVPWLPEPVFVDRLLAGSSVFLMAIADFDRRSASDGRGEAEALDLALAFAAAGLTEPYPAVDPPEQQELRHGACT